jgi:hypothetical protein
MTPGDLLEEVKRQGSQYLMCAELAKRINLPDAEALYLFASKQLGLLINTGLAWHGQAANAAAHDATEIVRAHNADLHNS